MCICEGVSWPFANKLVNKNTKDDFIPLKGSLLDLIVSTKSQRNKVSGYTERIILPNYSLNY